MRPVSGISGTPGGLALTIYVDINIFEWCQEDRIRPFLALPSYTVDVIERHLHGKADLHDEHLARWFYRRRAGRL